MRGNDDGFSLIEAMVAMVILAVAGIAFVGTSETHVRRIAALENRLAAGIVAQNRAAELAVGAVSLRDAGGRLPMLGGFWRVEHETEPTDDPALARVAVLVFSESDDRRYARYIAFVDREGAS